MPWFTFFVKAWKPIALTGLLMILLSTTILLIFAYAPTEATMGDVQRILYLHVSVAWCGLLGSIGMGICAAAYLYRRNLNWDHWSEALAEVSWLCISLTLVTGSLWARQAWGVWWIWEPRLTSAFVLWLVIGGIFLARSGMEDPHQRARVGSILAILAVADIPMIIMATRWFRGVHPVSPEMDQRMQLVLRVAALSFSVFFACLIYLRAKQLALVEKVETLESQGNAS